MKLQFATKLDTNGNRYFLTIDTETKRYTTESQWYHKSDFVTITRKERRTIIEQLDADGFTAYFTA